MIPDLIYLHIMMVLGHFQLGVNFILIFRCFSFLIFTSKAAGLKPWDISYLPYHNVMTAFVGRPGHIFWAD